MAQTVPPGQCKAHEKPEDRQQLRWSIAVSVYRRCGARCVIYQCSSVGERREGADNTTRRAKVRVLTLVSPEGRKENKEHLVSDMLAGCFCV